MLSLHLAIMFTEDRTGGSIGCSAGSIVEYATMVHDSPSLIGWQASTPVSVQCSICTTSQQCYSFSEKATKTDCMQSLRDSWETIQQRGISGKATGIILRSWSQGTHKKYEPYIKRWTEVCDQRETNPFDPSVTSMLDFQLNCMKRVSIHNIKYC